MGGEPLYTLILVGLGIDELSMNPVSVVDIKRIIRSITKEEVREIASQSLAMKTAKEIEDYLRSEMKKKFLDEFLLEQGEVES